MIIFYLKEFRIATHIKKKNLNFISNSGDPLDDGGFKVSNYIKVNDKVVKLDVRYVGDGYFDTNWQKIY